VLAAILFPFVLAVGAIGVNISMLWLERRALFTATDAAALAGAVAYSGSRTLASAPTDMRAACDTLMEVNGFDIDGNGFVQGTTTPARGVSSYECVYVPESPTSSPYVRVRAFSSPRLFLVPGVFPTRIGAASAAASGPPIALYGARPFSICREAIDQPSGQAAVAQWLDPAGEHYLSETKVWRIYSKPLCPSSPPKNVKGNFSQIVRTPWGYNEPPAISTSEFKALAVSGAQAPVFVCDIPRGDQVFAEDERRELLIGTEALPDPDSTVRNPATIPIALISYVPNSGNDCPGQSVSLRVTGYVGIRIHGITGSAENQYWDVSFHPLSVSGVCCADPGPGQTVTTTILCDPVLGCSRRTP